MTGPQHLGRRVRVARLAAGLTQQGLADRAGITERTVRSIENGATNPQQRIREGLARVLGDVIHDLHDENPDTGSTGRGKTTGDGTAAGKRSPAPVHNGG